MCLTTSRVRREHFTALASKVFEAFTCIARHRPWTKAVPRERRLDIMTWLVRVHSDLLVLRYEDQPDSKHYLRPSPFGF